MIITGLAVGAVLGLILQRGRFCITGAFRDLWVSGSARWFTAFLLAVTVQAVGVALLTGTGVITPEIPRPSVVAVTAGSFLFGSGIVLAGGCATGTYDRAGEGLVGSWLALAAYALTASAPKTGALRPLNDWVRGLWPAERPPGAVSRPGASSPYGWPMELRRLGRTGLRVSSIGLGTMTWGRDTDELEAKEQLDIFLDAGGTLLDTAASYCEGASEEVIGSLLADHVERRDVVLVSKAGVRTWRTGARATAADASRGTLLDTLDDSLARLGTDHLDLWLVQVPDPTTPMEETVDALRRAVASGRTRYVGISNHPAWACVHAADLLRERSGPGMAAVEVEHSLLARGIERELVPAAAGLGFGVIGFAPLGRGVLTGKYRASTPPDSRGASPHLRSYVAPYLAEPHGGVVEAVATAAVGLDRKPVEVALAWARDAPGITSTVLGARTPNQLRGALAGEDLSLPVQIRRALDEVTAPVLGYPERF